MNKSQNMARIPVARVRLFAVWPRHDEVGDFFSSMQLTDPAQLPRTAKTVLPQQRA
jgi:hypothetical protein